uniref:Col_cuticle_N domain-containing protein n=1 Tax=Steinernema glaseri TaxID=37863 RepID=A0A1I8ALA8_9BILA
MLTITPQTPASLVTRYLISTRFAISVGFGAFILCSLAFFHAIFSWCQLDFTTTQTDVDAVTGEYKTLSTLV